MKKNFILIIMTLYIAGCVGPTSVSTATPFPSPSPLPTFAPTPLPTETPQPTPTPIIEKDLNPIYTESIRVEFMSVQITTKLITDESLSRSNPQITKVSINPQYNNYKGEKSEIAIAHFVARTIFEVWWKNGEVKHEGSPTEDDFKAFMETWSLAQKENDPELWRKVQFSIFANDLNTQGYAQEKVAILPMYTGDQTLDGIKAIREVNIVFVRGPRMENITLYSDTGEYYGDGLGVNIDENNLFIYVAPGYGYNSEANGAIMVAGGMSDIFLFLIKNTGGEIKGKMVVDKSEHLYRLLVTNYRRSAIKVYPPSDWEKNYNP